MIKKIFKMVILIVVIIFIIFTAVFCFFFVGSAPVSQNITWGVDFSQMQSESLGLNWKENYSAIIDDLGAKNIKLHTQWDWVEGKQDNYYFGDIDWQMAQAKSKGVKIIYVVGMKSGRWPECHIPVWANNLSEQQQQDELLAYIKEVVLRYKDNLAIINWQVENEPLFKFGQCPSWYYKNDNFLKKEIALVKFLDPSRPVIVSDSGEQSSWFGAAKDADIVGITMYREVWAHVADGWGFYFKSFLSPVNYFRKAFLIQKIFGKNVMCIELQAEPWASKPFFDVPLKEQAKSMNLKIFKEDVEFAKQTGLDKFYFWGVEWWYWMKTTQNQPEIWNEAKTLFSSYRN
jgi:GH35 family endo-1,4-beta-xylanase